MQPLFELIATLNKEEKTFFTRFLPAFAPKASQSLESLFTEIEKATDPNDDKLKLRLAKSGYQGNYSRLKKQLYDTLLDTLSLFNEDNGREMLFSRQWQHIQSTMDKELLLTTEKALFQLWEFCDEVELIPQKLQILYMILDNYRKFGDQTHLHPRAYYTAAIENTHEQLNDLLEARRNLDDVFEIIENRTRGRKEEHQQRMEEIISQPFFDSASNRKSIQATHFHYFAQFWVYTFLRDKDKRLSVGKDWVAFIESVKNPDVFVTQALFAYMKLFETLSEHEDWQGFKALLDKMMLLPIKNSYGIRRRIETYYRVAATYYINIGENELSQKTVDECHQYYRNAKNRPMFVPETYQSMVQISFYLSNYDKVVDICNDFFKIERSYPRKDMRATIRIFYLFAQFEIGNADIMESLMRSSMRYMKEQDMLFDYERNMLKYLKQMVGAVNKSELQQFCATFKHELDTYDKMKMNTNFALHELMPNYFEQKVKKLSS